MSILTAKQMQSLFKRYYRVINYIDKINMGKSSNQKIKQIQIPSTLTQSIAYYYILNNPSIIGLSQIDQILLEQGNNKTHDFIYKGNSTINIEIKSTGFTNDYQRFRPNALKAHYALWLNFSFKSNNYDLAVFNPKNLKPVKNGEVNINWDNLLKNHNQIKLIYGLKP